MHCYTDSIYYTTLFSSLPQPLPKKEIDQESMHPLSCVFFYIPNTGGLSKKEKIHLSTNMEGGRERLINTNKCKIKGGVGGRDSEGRGHENGDDSWVSKDGAHSEFSFI